LDIVNDRIPEAEWLILGISWDLFVYEGLEFTNYYRELRLRAVGCPTTELPMNFPDPMNVEQFAVYIGKSVSWCRNNTKSVPKTQGKPGCKMVFFKADVDRWLQKRLNKGAE
jgi:hypothetical protein